MKIGMFSPYLPKHFGGGERHFLTTAAYLSANHSVCILIPSLPSDLKKIIAEYEKRFDLDLSAVQWQRSNLAAGTQSALASWQETAQYDAFFYLTDGSLFLNGSRNGVLHVQVPFSQSLSLINKLKLKTWQVLNTNSVFTKRVIEKSWGRKVDVIHAPFVDHSHIPAKLAPKKEDILTVGRIFAPGVGHNKKQDVLIAAFIEGCKQKAWKKSTTLHVVGALEPGQHNIEYLQSLKKMAQGWPIKFHVDVSNTVVTSLYAQCRVYWHAAGYQVDETTNPEMVEHFGMTPLEAMAWGCVPVVVAKGGITETITPNETGFAYITPQELIDHTQKILTQSAKEKVAWQDRVQEASQKYSLSRFQHTIDEMIGQPAKI